MLNVLPNLVDGVTANVLAYAVLLAAVATITMALLELVKPLRAHDSSTIAPRSRRGFAMRTASCSC